MLVSGNVYEIFSGKLTCLIIHQKLFMGPIPNGPRSVRSCDQHFWILRFLSGSVKSGSCGSNLSRLHTYKPYYTEQLQDFSLFRALSSLIYRCLTIINLTHLTFLGSIIPTIHFQVLSHFSFREGILNFRWQAFYPSQLCSWPLLAVRSWECQSRSWDLPAV